MLTINFSVCNTCVPITLLFTIRKLKKKILNFIWCPTFHIGSLIIGLFDDLGWCPILAQPWVRLDTNDFLKRNGTPDGKTNGLGFAISGPIIHTNFSGEKIPKK
jgi:hypothetical protein